MEDLRSFFEVEHFIMGQPEGTYEPRQLGASITCFTSETIDLDETDIVLIGCNEWRGAKGNVNGPQPAGNTADAVREHLYRMYYWHDTVKIADLGNIRLGLTVDDTRAGLTMVLEELHVAGKIALIIGGSHDLMLQQYEVFRKAGHMAVAAVADMLIDLDEAEGVNSGSFLMDMLTGTPNYIAHYSHIAFQSYYAHPHMLETLDKLRFDFYRLGKVREHIEDMEPVLRGSTLFGFDMNTVRFSEAPANINGSPNGLNGEEACTLTRYAGMSSRLSSMGIYGFNGEHDQHGMTARLVSQMVWYFIDGVLVRKSEASLADKAEFIEYHVAHSDFDATFLKSKRTNRWWMKLPDGSMVPCSYADYIIASRNELPERWLREQERLT